MLTTLALLVLLTSTVMVLGNLRDVVSDTMHTLSTSALRAQEDGVLLKRLSFAALWGLMFALSYF